MTIDELYRQLSGLSASLASASDDEAKLNLQMLVLQLEKQIVAESFDPLTDLAVVAGADVEQLKILIPQVDQAIATEQQRVQLVQTIISLATSALRAAGVALP
jgi:hypothetical protein